VTVLVKTDDRADGLCMASKPAVGSILSSLAKKCLNRNVGNVCMVVFSGSVRDILLRLIQNYQDLLLCFAKKSGKVKFTDGHEMARLTIDYGLGVTKTRVHVAKIDRDYFEGL
jgi:hypothetical protein